MGVKCGCYHGRFSNDDGLSVNHAKIHSDHYIADFITNSLINGQKSEGVHPDYEKFTHNDWDEFEEKCSLFTVDRTKKEEAKNN